MHNRNSGGGMQQVIQMCSSFDANKSTKGASKLRRDLINGEIANLRDLLPLPSSTRQRLSQLQLMALVCVYVRKANYFQQVFKRHHELGHPFSTPNFGFSKALSGFLIMMTQNGKLLYISDNAAEYLGHSMEDLLIHGDSVYDIIDKADHGTVQAELLRSSNAQNPPGEETRLFLCRMNVSRNARRQMRFGDQKVVLLQGHFLSYLPLCSRNEPVFVATCTPVAMPETRECVVQGATNVFTSIHAMDMKFMHIDRNGEYYLGYTRTELGGISWYQLIHWNYMREAQSKHRLISQSEQEKSCILLLRLQTRPGNWIWVHCVLQVKDGTESSSQQQTQQQQSIIVATNQVLSEREAAVMRANAWLYHYYTVQTKLQYGLAYPEATGGTAGSPTAAAAAARLAAAAYFPTAPQLAVMNYGGVGAGLGGQHMGGQQPPSHPHHYHPHHHPHLHHIAPHHQISPDSSSGYSSITTMPTMPPPIHSPHNGGYPPYHHPAIAFDMANSSSGKESPLDFSLAASNSVFEFPLGYGSPSYWTHHNPHHHHPHSYMNMNMNMNVNVNLNSMNQSQNQSQNHHSNHHQRLTEGSTTTVAASTGSPHNSHWSQHNHNHLHQHHHHQASIATLASPRSHNNNNNNSSNNNSNNSNNSANSLTSVTNLSPSNASSGHATTRPSPSSSISSPRSSKRMKKNKTPPPTLSTNTTSNQPATRASLIGSYSNINMNINLMDDGSGSDDTSAQPLPLPLPLRHNHAGQGLGGNGNRSGQTLLATSPFPYHQASSRLSYKLMDSHSNRALTSSASEDEASSSVSVKEESITMACPLTPSPIWEGQTQRVPDLTQQFYNTSGSGGQRYYNGGGRSSSGSEERDVEGVMAGATDLIHCVPTFQPTAATTSVPTYLQPPTAPTAATAFHPPTHASHHNTPPGIHSSSSMSLHHSHHPMLFANATSAQGLLQMTETGSPNKENRLPSTPESDHTEKEDGRGIKWESL